MNSVEIHKAFAEALRARQAEGRAELAWQSCFGRCRQAPNCLVRPALAYEPAFAVAIAPVRPGPGTAFYSGLIPGDAQRIVDEHVLGGRVVRELIARPEPEDTTKP